MTDATMSCSEQFIILYSILLNRAFQLLSNRMNLLVHLSSIKKSSPPSALELTILWIRLTKLNNKSQGPEMLGCFLNIVLHIVVWMVKDIH